MNKRISKIVGLFLVAISASYYFFITSRRNNIDNLIIKKGVYCSAILTDDFASKGSVRAFHFSFSLNGVLMENKRNVGLSFFKKHKIGDTIIVKALKSKLPESLICEEMEYKPCFGQQPKNGWKELPKCK